VGLALYLVHWQNVVLQCFTVGWVIWPVKIVPDMTCNVFGGMLNHTLLDKINDVLIVDSWHSMQTWVSLVVCVMLLQCVFVLSILTACCRPDTCDASCYAWHWTHHWGKSLSLYYYYAFWNQLLSRTIIDCWINQVRRDSNTLPVELWRHAVMVLERHNGPHRLRNHDDDDDDYEAIQYETPLHVADYLPLMSVCLVWASHKMPLWTLHKCIGTVEPGCIIGDSPLSQMPLLPCNV